MQCQFKDPAHDEVYSIQHYVIMFVSGQWFSLDTLVSSTNKTDSHDITEILLKVALNTITLTNSTLSSGMILLQKAIHSFL